MPRPKSAERSATRRAVRQHDPEKPPLPKAPQPPGVAPCSPIPTGLEHHAQRLIHAAGSPEAAKEAVEAAATREQQSDFREDALALRLGFASRQAMLAASQPIAASDHTPFWATHLDGRGWVVWNNDDMSAKTVFGSFEEAIAAISPATCA